MKRKGPPILTIISILCLIGAIFQLSIGILMISSAPLVLEVYPSLAFMAPLSIYLFILGLLDLYIFYNLWSGRTVGWFYSLLCVVINVIARVLILAFYGFETILLIVYLFLDIVILFLLSRPKVIAFFGGASIRDIYKKVMVEMQPTIKEIKFTVRLVRKSPLSIVGSAIVAFYAIIALIAPVLAPPGDITQGGDPYMMPKAGVLLIPQPPSPKHPFGTMEGQYDIYYGCIWGARTAFRIGLTVELSCVVIGIVIGVIAAYYGGWIDEILMRFTDIILAFPGLILCMTLVVVFVPLGMNRLDAVMLALTLVGWPGYARLIRGEVLRVKNEDYVEAAKSVGCSDLRIIVRHILPNSIYPVIITATLGIGSTVLAAAALSFLGLGAPDGYSDWGWIIAKSRNWIYGPVENPFAYWYTFVIPGVFISTFVLGWNLLGDALRDILDPTLRRK
ncbi:MAG: ABC transporter permease [Candidatus Bathyarchaeia archaeon]